MPNRTDNALLTDLYQLTMLHGYHSAAMEKTAVFEFFVRKLPARRGFLVAAGLEQAVEYLENFRFTDDDLAWAKESGLFNAEFIDYLAELTFTGDVDAMPEGTIFFPDEPIIRVTAPLPQAQLVESRLINLLHFQTLIASKAARCVLAAPGKMLVDFGFRRSHGAEAGLLAARASYVAGFTGTATVAASPSFGIPVFGTMAHSFVQAFGDERAAFEHFARVQPDNVVLLIDTYDTEAAALKAVDIASLLKAEGITIKAVRIDSGDLAVHAKKVRKILDDGGLEGVGIFASGGLDEYRVAALLRAGAPIDGFGIGTALDTSADAPYLDCAYKLQEYADRARRKRSEGKATWPGRKQVFRSYDSTGSMSGDLLTLEGERGEGEALIIPVMKGGRAIDPPEPLDTIRRRVAEQLRRLPEPLRTLDDPFSYRVTVDDSVKRLAAEVDADAG